MARYRSTNNPRNPHERAVVSPSACPHGHRFSQIGFLPCRGGGHYHWRCDTCRETYHDPDCDCGALPTAVYD